MIPLTVDYLYLDRETCGRCGGTESALDAALEAVTPALAALGVRVDLRKVHVTSLAQARETGFHSSPTLRVAGHDVQAERLESRCGDCTDLAGGTPVDCREWLWRGERYTQAPVGLIVDRLLRAALDPGDGAAAPAADPTRDAAAERNLAGFFARDGRSCCPG